MKSTVSAVISGKPLSGETIASEYSCTECIENFYELLGIASSVTQMPGDIAEQLEEACRLETWNNDSIDDTICAEVMCEMYCEHGFEVDANTGCEICACAEPPVEPEPVSECDVMGIFMVEANDGCCADINSLVIGIMSGGSTDPANMANVYRCTECLEAYYLLLEQAGPFGVLPPGAMDILEETCDELLGGGGEGDDDVNDDVECHSMLDCPVSSDEFCGFDCLDNECVAWCESPPPQSSLPACSVHGFMFIDDYAPVCCDDVNYIVDEILSGTTFRARQVANEDRCSEECFPGFMEVLTFAQSLVSERERGIFPRFFNCTNPNRKHIILLRCSFHETPLKNSLLDAIICIPLFLPRWRRHRIVTSKVFTLLRLRHHLSAAIV